MGRKRDAARFELNTELDVLRHEPLDWFLLTGNRLIVSALLLTLVSATIWWAVLSGLAPLVEPTPTLFLLFALIGGNFTLITIVVSISQFVLARHLESPGEVREQMREVIGFREEVSRITQQRVVPVTPGGLFELLFESIERDVRALERTGWTPADPALEGYAERLLDDLAAHIEYVQTLLAGGSAGVRYALIAVLDTNYSRYFVGAYRLRASQEEPLPEAVEGSLNRLERHVEQVDVARRYFKTIYIQSELASLSRTLLFIGIPVQVVSVVLMLLFTDATGPTISQGTLRVVIPLVVTAGFAPIVLLTTYILRLATVVQRTAAMYPFTTNAEQ
ncbi:hypothetical protein N0B31_20945 [Salinirubellus salinus]|uniref:Uncharacterized protein n=1 Tax=Salinirubellus salinus TaxID=1364945 RepID=A0A9E7R2X2_9EURY|nr:hypothetical protein [Salinirubellus salinus]UWM54577.1 hypothetical protein N0B31_20945 [Salinirubellus salinus]